MIGRLVSRPSALVGLVLAGTWVVCALFAPWLAPADPVKSVVPLLTPLSRLPDGSMAWLGTDTLGRDILSRLIYGARAVVFWAALATATAYLIGVLLGLAAGYFRGAVDAVLSFVANVILSFPVLVLYLLILTKFGPSGANIILAVTFASSPAIFRIVRALTIELRERDFVLASVTQGESTLRILCVDILPNVTGPLIVDGCLRLGYTAITIGVLGFLGLGLPPPTPDWGGMVEEGRALAIAFPHLVLFPCIAISSLMIGLSLVADGLRQASLVATGRDTRDDGPAREQPA